MLKMKISYNYKLNISTYKTIFIKIQKIFKEFDSVKR